MMKIKQPPLKELSTALFLLVAPYAAADAYNLQMTGTILSRTCDVSSSQSQTVNIGQFSVSHFAAAGDTTAAKRFTIDLVNCGSAATGTKLTFSGTNDSDNPALLALSDTGSTGAMATGVGIEILDGNQQPLAINTLSSAVYELSPGSNSLPFYLRYKATQNVVTAGDASSVMYFDLQYQ
ncbi:fimbrial protein [Buttiauxella agrestis]|uniref:fimbrial protein n=1 Tax=Buttiauxella agrestis TaxID=82977 RepID=UPI001E3AD2FA|nr:fimbrial protein [Buttiauxella agrestis]